MHVFVLVAFSVLREGLCFPVPINCYIIRLLIIPSPHETRLIPQDIINYGVSPLLTNTQCFYVVHLKVCRLFDDSVFLHLSELHGMDRTVLMRALKQLEHKGKLAIFKGTSADDEGVKFSL